MGVASVGSRETVRFGEENVPETEYDLHGVARNSIDLDETQESVEQELHEDANLGVGETLGGYGEAHLHRP